MTFIAFYNKKKKKIFLKWLHKERDDSGEMTKIAN